MSEPPVNRGLQRWDVVGLGVIVVDLLAVLEVYPQVDTKQDVRVVHRQTGGPVPTALVQLTRFGWRSRFIGWWGDDPFGAEIEADLRREGVEFDSACRHPGIVTGHSQVWIESASGTRTSVTHRPDSSQTALTATDCAAISAADVVHLDGWPPPRAVEAARVARAAGVRVVVDTGSPKPGIEQLLRVADVVNAPRRFVEEFLNTDDLVEGARAIAELGPSLVTVTDGADGAVLWAVDAGVYHARSLPGCVAVDTNGAGDVFSAALIHAVLSDWSAERCLKFAVAAAGLMCGQMGNRAALPGLDDASSAARRVCVW